MSSVSGIFSVRGSEFGVPVAAADEVTATAPARKFRLPDDTIELLCRAELTPRTPGAKREWDELVGARHALNERTKEYVERTYAKWRADLEVAHEKAKEAVRAQQSVLEGLKRTLAEDSQEAIRADNACRLAGNAAHAAEVGLKNLSRFASKKEIAEAEKRVELATKKMEAAERKAAEWGEQLNRLKIVTIPNENLKLDALLEKELELSAVLEGRDPFLTKFGFLER